MKMVLMITLNEHEIKYLLPSGIVGFDGQGWLHQKPCLKLIEKSIDLRYLATVTKTITIQRTRGNFCLWNPFRVIKFISQDGKEIPPPVAFVYPKLVKGIVNAVGLTNPGFSNWLIEYCPKIKKSSLNVIVSIAGSINECVKMAKILSNLKLKNIVGIELNVSCPSSPFLLENIETIVKLCKEVKKVVSSNLALLLKLNYVQPYVEIAEKVEGIVDAISINSVPWRIVFKSKVSPLQEFGGGGVSGKLAQPFTHLMIKQLSQTKVPVIGSSVWEFEDIYKIMSLGAQAVHFGAIFLILPFEVIEWLKKLIPL